MDSNIIAMAEVKYKYGKYGLANLNFNLRIKEGYEGTKVVLVLKDDPDEEELIRLSNGAWVTLKRFDESDGKGTFTTKIMIEEVEEKRWNRLNEFYERQIKEAINDTHRVINPLTILKMLTAILPFPVDIPDEGW